MRWNLTLEASVYQPRVAIDASCREVLPCDEVAEGRALVQAVGEGHRPAQLKLLRCRPLLRPRYSKRGLGSSPCATIMRRTSPADALLHSHLIVAAAVGVAWSHA